MNIFGMSKMGGKNLRKSNIELFRIVAMALVLVLHSNYFSVPQPCIIDLIEKPLESFGRIFIQSSSIGCVNMFILISGWFSIKTKLSSYTSIMFQYAYFAFGIYLLLLMIGLREFDLHGIYDVLLLSNWNWFIKAYICLLIISPILNAYTNTVNSHHLKTTIISFFVFQTIFGFLSNGAEFLQGGYSTMSFIGLYLLARYCRLYPDKYTTLKKKHDFIIIIGLILTLAIGSFIFTKFNISISLIRYTNPIVVLISLYSLLFFSKLNINNVFINTLASSSFAVYLLHMDINVINYYKSIAIYIYSNYSGVMYILGLAILVIFFYLMAFVLDQPRKMLYDRVIYPLIEKYDSKL